MVLLSAQLYLVSSSNEQIAVRKNNLITFLLKNVKKKHLPAHSWWGFKWILYCFTDLFWLIQIRRPRCAEWNGSHMQTHFDNLQQTTSEKIVAKREIDLGQFNSYSYIYKHFLYFCPDVFRSNLLQFCQHMWERFKQKWVHMFTNVPDTYNQEIKILTTRSNP